VSYIAGLIDFSVYKRDICVIFYYYHYHYHYHHHRRHHIAITITITITITVTITINNIICLHQYEALEQSAFKCETGHQCCPF